jgi:peptide deformylase
MAILRIRTLGDPVLKTKAAPVTVFDDALAKLAADMHETMDAAPGVGLAAPQVGILERLFVYNSRDDDEPEAGTLVNPEIVWRSEETVEMEEGCLSIPGQYFPVTRPESVRVRAQDVTGAAIERDASGFVARIFQHEIDHLDGILFIDHLTPEVRKEAMKALRDQDFGMAPPPAKRTRAL